MTRKHTAQPLIGFGRVLSSSMTETLWPTRCAVCEEPGFLLCPECAARLSYIDRTQACPRCGGPFGFLQCTECNEISLQSLGMERLPYESCANVALFDEATRRIVVTFKDKGERRLAQTMARLMLLQINPSIIATVDATSYIPASTSAIRRRGFDHGRILAESLAQLLEKPCLGLLARPSATDQRELGRKGRMQNMSGAFSANPAAQGRMPQTVLLIDDVMTTGATLAQASQTLRANGVETIHCLTFARAW